MRKKHYIIIVSILASIFLQPMFANAEFSDVPQNHPNRLAVDYLSGLDIIRGQANSSSFDPLGNLNRAEWAVILTRYLGVDPNPANYSNCFPDVSDEWFAAAVCYASEQGWIKGYQAGPEAGKFIAFNQLNFAEITVILERIFDWPSNPGAYWYSGAIEQGMQSNIIQPGQAFDRIVTRAEASEVLFRTIALDKYEVKVYDPILAELMISEISGDEEEAEPIVAQLKSYADEPVDASVTRGARYVPVLRFRLEAESLVTLRQVGVRRISVGKTEDLGIGRLVANGVVVKEAPFFVSENMVYWYNLGIPVSPGNPLLLEMNVDFAEDAGAHLVYQFQVSPESLEFDENVDLQGDTLIGEEFRMSAIDSDRVTISNHDTKLKLPFVLSERETIARFSITAGDHDVLIRRIRLEDSEEIDPRYFTNFRMSAGNQEVSFLKNINRSVLDFIVNDFLIEAGESQTFTVKADIGDARTADQVRLYMDAPEHLHAVDLRYGTGTRVLNEFDRDRARCLGSETIDCPSPGLRKHCSQDDIEAEVRDCI